MSSEYKKKKCKRCDEIVFCSPENPRPKCKCHKTEPEVACQPIAQECQIQQTCNCITIGRGVPNKSMPVNQRPGLIYIDESTGLWYILYGCNWAILPMPCLV